VTTQPDSPSPTSPTKQLRATLRIDTKPDGKKAQAVWLEHGDKRWVVDYRPREFWKGFEGAEVIATGQCYEPFGQAINATHFRVDHIRFATVERGRSEILELGPEQKYGGRFERFEYPAGSKRGGDSEIDFHADDGTAYIIIGSSEQLPAVATPVVIKARTVTPDYSHHAQRSGPSLWITVIDPAEEQGPKIVPCPE